VHALTDGDSTLPQRLHQVNINLVAASRSLIRWRRTAVTRLHGERERPGKSEERAGVLQCTVDVARARERFVHTVYYVVTRPLCSEPGQASTLHGAYYTLQTGSLLHILSVCLSSNAFNYRPENRRTADAVNG